MKIIFFGTNNFSAEILKALVENHFEVVAVVSQPDKVNGRNGKIAFSPIKNFCLDNGLPLYQFNKLNLEGESVLKAYQPDVFITASFGQIIKQNILDIPARGTYNVHASLLPKLRGAAPIQRAIMEGETKTGITIMKTELGLDTGEMYLQKSVEILQTDNLQTLTQKLIELGKNCLIEFLNDFDALTKQGTPQDDSISTYAKMIKDEDYHLNFNAKTADLFNRIRALEDCYFFYDGKRYKVKAASISNLTGKAGEILACNSKLGLIVATLDGSLSLDTIQPEGKQPMPAKAYMNANKFKLGSFIEQ